MADKVSKDNVDTRVSLKSSKKEIFSNAYTLKFPNILTLSEFENTSTELNSPSFEFAYSTWRFQVISDNVMSHQTFKEFDVYLIKLNNKERRQRIFYSVTFLDANDEKYDVNSNDYCFGEDEDLGDDDEEKLIGTFDNEKLSYDKRDTLTLIAHLICHESAEGDTLAMDKNADLLSSDFKTLLKKGSNYDLTLRVSKKEFRVHHDILVARSPVFEAMLSHVMTEKDGAVVEIQDCDPEAMEQFLSYVYSGKVEKINMDNVHGLYSAADKYNMKLLKQKCAKFIISSLSPSTICDVLQFASNHNDDELLKGASEYFVQHTGDIFGTAEWKSFLKTNIDVASELLLKASKKWTDK